MSQQTTLDHRPDAYDLSLTAHPGAQPKVPSGAISLVSATVLNTHNHRPVEGVTVKFSSSASQAKLSEHTVKTDRHGKASINVTYPHPAQTVYGGEGLVPIRASIKDEAASLTLVFYDEGLMPVSITNLKHGNVIDKESIAAGIQVVIYPWQGTVLGNIYTLFWGDHAIQRAYDGTNFPWVVEAAKAFNPEKIFRNGTYDVFYEIKDNAGNVGFCKPISVRVINSPETQPI